MKDKFTKKAQLENDAQEGAVQAGETIKEKAINPFFADPDPNAQNAPAEFFPTIARGFKRLVEADAAYRDPTIDISQIGETDPVALGYSTDPSLGPPVAGKLATGEAAAQPSVPELDYVPYGEPPVVSPGEAEGKGKGGISGTLTGTVGPQVPGEYTAALAGYLKRSADAEFLGLQARAAYFNKEWDIHNDILPLWEADYNGTKKVVDQMLTEAETETQAIGDLIDAARSDQINPGQFFANIGDAGKFSAAIAVGAGAMASAYAGGPNTAYNIISAAIDRNVRAQVINQQHNRSLIAHQANFVNTIRGLAKDRMMYGNYLRIGLTAIAQAKIGMARADLNSALSQLASHDVYNKLNAALVQAQINAITASQQKLTVKWNGMRQYAQGMKMLNAGQMQAAQAGTGGASQGPGSLSPAASGMNRRKPTGETAETAQPDSPDAANMTGNPEAIAKGYADQIKRDAEAQKLTRQQIDQLRNEKVAELQSGNDTAKAVAAQLKSMGEYSLVPTSQTATVPITINGKRYAARPNDVFKGLKGKAVSDAVAQVQSAGQMAEYAKEMYQLLGITNFNSPHAALQHLKVMGDERLMVPASSPEAQRIFNRLATLAIRIQQLGRDSDNTRNAINTLPEMAREALRQGQHVSAFQHIWDWLQKNPELRQARFEGVMDLFQNDFEAAQNATGLILAKP